MDAARLAGQVSVVTGGALGIGGGISRRLAAAGGQCTTVIGDIREPEVVSLVAQTALNVAGARIDILVNNVGDFRPAARDFLHSTEDQWQQLYELNLLHVLRMSHALLPAMI